MNPLSWLKWLEQQVLFAPERSLRGTPEHVGLEFDDVFPTTADGVRLHGWHIPGPSPDVVWLIFHGNGGDVSVRLNQYQEIHRRYGASIVAIDYRGYGRSEGAPSERGFYADALAAHMLATELHPGKKIILFGRSMGGPVAAQLASITQPTALILEATISSVPDVIRERAAWTRFVPVHFIMQSRFNLKKHVTNLPVPTLVIHGDSDRTVSPTNVERIFGTASDPKQLEIVPGGDHEGLDLVDPERYHLVLTEFLRKYDAL
jgi:pimeloyl-ACP methyl ester carboxylesterase